jgi:hypothetical protein
VASVHHRKIRSGQSGCNPNDGGDNHDFQQRKTLLVLLDSSSAYLSLTQHDAT